MIARAGGTTPNRSAPRRLDRFVPIGRNDPCWCGSGLKYKSCHLDRHRQVPPTCDEVQQAIRRAYTDEMCLHPDAPTACGKIIRAHALQRRGVLDRIARNSHVCALRSTVASPPDFESTVRERLVGIHEASTFNGFCTRHDHEIFAAVEKRGFDIGDESALLLGFRSLCYGYYQTVAGLKVLEFFGLLDRGQPHDVQVKWQAHLNERKDAVRFALAAAKAQMDEMGDRMRLRDFRGVHYYALEFPRPTTLAAAFAWIPTHDFEDRDLRASTPAQTPDLLLWSALPTERGGVFLYVWVGRQPISVEFIRSLHRVPDSRLANAMVRFSSLCENTYFAPAWWDEMPEPTREWMRKRLRATIDTGPIKPALQPDSLSLANWGNAQRVTNLAGAELGA